MPAYDFRCEACRWRGVLRFRSYAEYDSGEKRCPRCQSLQVVRSIKRVALLRSEQSRFDTSIDDNTLDNLADADPQQLGRFMRRMSANMDEDFGDDFREVVNRLEKGEDPDSIEKSMPDLADAESSAAGAIGNLTENVTNFSPASGNSDNT
jgi:putative FmdB family regulatory protein